MTDAPPDKIKVFRVSRWTINYDAQRGSVDQHISEVHVSRVTDKSVWLGNSWCARRANDEAFCDSYVDALVELKRMKAALLEENKSEIGVCESRIARCTQSIETLIDFMALIDQELYDSEGQ